ncbi:MAG: 2-C-methyl-D-erythritol 4-phosphate cytidylyltransferase [cyanobacterium endosymbiont of Rhopalodia musculus]|uniref:2-C-methyl-D-erythritol 4-phosphate cytidylyltransferase n=1 Tax=cyanobacterium endosymbiont of Epithemia clementina EcSB TaxID=3034674 RepID=UPI002480356B|nr:2-C-methyl-D-erythritol 4-phosphate cytidylyltransferase [cyanobacterium endosymbiont of Epithemia clementina EcSB]WGT68253.1 2-C-methyl-D-erythritol 4-phosphate cytidylyltransferase [cyanobacterium endosymbiont of Epithemia clementina EcSB]
MHLLIPAAGLGKRMGSDQNKLLLSLLGKPLLTWTLLAAEASEKICWIGIIGKSYDFPSFQEILANLSVTKPVELIQGGKTRQQSVYNGLQALSIEVQRILIHDGARCLVTPELFDRCAEELLTCQGLITAIPVRDTIKVVDQHKFVQNSPNRSQLWAAQTPQGFDVKLLKKCHEKGRISDWKVTDDSALFEKCKLPVKIVDGEETNLKVTTPIDLKIAEFLLRKKLDIS